MAGLFTVFRRTRQKTSKDFYVQFRDPETGVQGNALSINKLFHQLGGSVVEKVNNKQLAYAVAQKASDSGIVFNRKNDPVVIDYVAGFWDYDTSDYIKRRNMEKPNSIGRAYANDCKASFLKHVPSKLSKNLRLSQLKVSHIEKVKLAMFDDGLSNSTVNRVLQAFRSPIEEAYRLGIIPTNIADRIKNSTPVPKVKKIPTPQEIAKLLASLNKDTKPGTVKRVYFMAIALAVTTGMRQGEIRGLQKGGISIVSETTALITVCHSFSDVDKGLKTTKGKRSRTVFTSASLAKAMLAYEAQNPYDNGYVFWNPASKRYPIDGHDLTEFLKAELVNIGITLQQQEQRGIDFHSLRHYYASVMSNAIGSDETRRLLGH